MEQRNEVPEQSACISASQRARWLEGPSKGRRLRRYAGMFTFYVAKEEQTGNPNEPLSGSPIRLTHFANFASTLPIQAL